MRLEEAEEIAKIIRGLDLPAGTKCLNLGSSTRAFREIDQPHIHTRLLKPLEECGIRFVHCDMKADEGVDLVGDALEGAFQDRLAAEQAQLLLCCNMLEHLTDRRAFVGAFDRFLPPGGYAVVSVPNSYPFHPDPIDNLFRPTPAEIAALFPSWRMVSGQIIRSSNFLGDLAKLPSPLSSSLKYLFRLFSPWYRPAHWKPLAHRSLWLFRAYKVSIAVLQKPQT